MHSLRRANITWRQEVGASAIEASKIAGHSSVNMTNDYTHVQLKRQDELTRAIQERLGEAADKAKKQAENTAGLRESSNNDTLELLTLETSQSLPSSASLLKETA